jgi:thiol:disulfide interchange protein DsbD
MVAMAAMLVPALAPTLAAAPHVAKGLTVELVAADAEVVPGRPLTLGVRLKPDEGFHTYWRQPGLVGLTPTVELSLPKGFKAGEILWPEPQRGLMGEYGVWCLKREVALVIPVEVPADLDPARTPSVTIGAKVVWMACSRTCHPGTAELSLTLPVIAEMPDLVVIPPAAGLIEQTRQEQPVADDRWTFSAVQHGPEGGFSLTITPPAGRQVPKDAYFYGHQRLVDSNVEPVRHSLANGAVRLDLALVEEPDAIPEALVGELWSAEPWDAKKGARLLAVRAPIVREAAAK